jgi:serine/arginine repetitive matrix protein 1
MAFSGGFRGVSAAQDARFSDKQQKLLKTMKFSKELLQTKVDMSRVNWSVMRGYITRKTEEMLGFEDEVLNGYIAEQLEGQEVS